jgi:gliding motility-associated-like protein
VHNLPDIKIANVAETPCYGDKIDLIATGGVTYTWLPADAVKQDDSGHVYYEALTPATLTVTGVDAYGCSNNDSIAYTNITPCCLFSYPTAFTPNNDGRNDKYFIVTYGNMQSFYLNIYNRWGERVFNTFDQYTGWDGTYHGQPCEVGTYFFYMKAKCLTGREEIKSGTITLVR